MRALRWAWQAACTAPGHRPDDPAGWHGRHLPGFLARLAEMIPPECRNPRLGHRPEAGPPAGRSRACTGQALTGCSLPGPPAR